MKTFWYGLAIGIFFSLFVFQLVSVIDCENKVEDCNSDDAVQELRDLQAKHDLQKNLTMRFMDNLLAQDDPESYLSHIKLCQSRNDTEQCLYELVRETEDTSLWLLLPEEKLAPCSLE
ncbi:MAG: hypothetical protein ACLFP2_02395 [Candidatus Woesearchaeota archaeon]